MISTHQRSEAENCFDFYDTDCDGRISLAEFKLVIADLGLFANDDELEAMRTMLIELRENDCSAEPVGPAF